MFLKSEIDNETYSRKDLFAGHLDPATPHQDYHRSVRSSDIKTSRVPLCINLLQRTRQPRSLGRCFPLFTRLPRAKRLSALFQVFHLLNLNIWIFAKFRGSSTPKYCCHANLGQESFLFFMLNPTLDSQDEMGSMAKIRLVVYSVSFPLWKNCHVSPHAPKPILPSRPSLNERTWMNGWYEREASNKVGSQENESYFKSTASIKRREKWDSIALFYNTFIGSAAIRSAIDIPIRTHFLHDLVRKVSDSELNHRPVNLEGQLFCSNSFPDRCRLKLGSAILKHHYQEGLSSPATETYKTQLHVCWHRGVKEGLPALQTDLNRKPRRWHLTRYGDSASHSTYVSFNVQQEIGFKVTEKVQNSSYQQTRAFEALSLPSQPSKVSPSTHPFDPTLNFLLGQPGHRAG